MFLWIPLEIKTTDGSGKLYKNKISNGMDQVVLNFFLNSRADWLSFLVIIITYSGSYMLVGGLTALSAASFYIHNHSTKALQLLVTVGGSAGTAYIIKHVFYRARPVAEAFYLESSSSFPSGHATMAMALYGFLVYATWSHDKHHFKNPLIIFLSVLIILVGTSRLYLGVHYLTDVLAGYAIGLVWILISHFAAKSKIWPLRGGERL